MEVAILGRTKNFVLGIIAVVIFIPLAYVSLVVVEILIDFQISIFHLGGWFTPYWAEYGPPLGSSLVAGYATVTIIERWINRKYLMAYRISASALPLLCVLAGLAVPMLSNIPFTPASTLNGLGGLIGLNFIEDQRRSNFAD